MSESFTTRQERYGRAAVSGQLRTLETRPTDLDTIAAAGMAGIQAPLGIALWRAKYANDRHAFRHALSLLTARAAHVARKRRWVETPRVVKLITARVFTWSVFGVCPQCQGRGHLSIAAIDATGGRGVLEDEMCPACYGYGITPIERAVPVEHIGRAKDIAQLLAQADQDIDRGMFARLSSGLARKMEGL